MMHTMVSGTSHLRQASTQNDWRKCVLCTVFVEDVVLEWANVGVVGLESDVGIDLVGDEGDAFGAAERHDEIDLGLRKCTSGRIGRAVDNHDPRVRSITNSLLVGPI